MKYTVLLTVLALIVATVQAVALGTNAERMARGLPPKAPRKFYREVAATNTQPKKPKPSNTPGTCSTGPVQCCQQLTSAKDPIASLLLGLLGILHLDDILVGITCSPLSVIGIGSGKACSAHTVCCENNSHGGLISIGCLPITL